MKYLLGLLISLHFISAQTDPNWSINPPDYQYNGSITAHVYIDDAVVSDGTLSAFVGEEIRGVQEAIFFPPAGDYYFPIMVYSNVTSEETLTFKYFNGSEIIDLDETHEFVSDMIIGNGFAPLELHGVTTGGEDILGCIDSGACNYNPLATINDDSCEYPIDENHNCNGDCIVNIDCLGECGGSAIEDECGVCEGNGIPEGECDCFGSIIDCNGDCDGIAEIDICGECVGGETGQDACVAYNYELSLNAGANLISFYALPEDNSVENIFLVEEEYVYNIYEEGSFAGFYNGTFVGSLQQIVNESGYWVRSLNTFDLLVEDAWDTPDNLIYNIEAGVNLVSFPNSGSLELNYGIPDEFEENFNFIMGESEAALRLETGEWVGSLTHFYGGKGYWFSSETNFEFNYDLSSLSRTVAIENKVEKVAAQSTLQSFYFIKNIENENIQTGDWIYAYCNNVLVGGRKWVGEYTDIPVMGYDGYERTFGFCEENQIPIFILETHGTSIELTGDYEGWSSNKVSIVENLFDNSSIELPGKLEILSIYPNPFNPNTKITISSHVEKFATISILDISGRHVETVYNNLIPKGVFEIYWDAKANPSGIYFLNILSDGYSTSSKLMLVK